MNISKIIPDDPRLTAYALGELDAAEQVAIEAAIKDDPAAQTAVAQIRALSGDLSAALAKEPLPFVVPPKIEAAPPAREPYQPRKFIRFPFYLIGGLAAACVVAMFVVQKQEVTRRDIKLAEAKTEALYQKELAKLEEKSRSLIEIELKKEGEGVVHLPTTKPESEPVAQPSAPAQPRQNLPVLVADVTTGTPPMSNEVITMAPFSVEARHEMSFKVTQTLAGTRLPAGIAGVGGSAGAASPQAWATAAYGRHDFNTETYDRQVDNDYLDAIGNPLSTFSIDVDTASYANARRFLNLGQRPPQDSVRIEEFVNYFPYHYAAPKDATPFSASMEVASAPWNPEHRLVRIGLKGREIPEAERPALNLVFLLDVSGSMNEPKKLPLVKESMRVLVEKLKPTDRVAIVVYAGDSGLALPSTPISQKQEVLGAIEELSAGGSTNGAMGIQLAYDIAKANFIKDGANRVVLCTDGDFNIGVTNQGDLTRLIEEKAKSGVFLTVLGFGMSNYKDSTLEKLADKGNGNYGYVDNFAEAKKLLADQLSGTLVTIAKDVKIQVEFNPAKVKSYRLIGYENRMLKKEDFNNDKIDAGEIGAGHTVTALYEVVPVDVDSPADIPSVDPLKYQAKGSTKSKLAKAADVSPELLTVKIRYKAPEDVLSKKLEFPLVDSGAKFANASQDFKFAAAVAGFGMMLRESTHKGTTTFDSVLGWAEDGLGEDAGGYRHEFMDLVKKARGISG